jgi:hypothetical protein
MGWPIVKLYIHAENVVWTFSKKDIKRKLITHLFQKNWIKNKVFHVSIIWTPAIDYFLYFSPKKKGIQIFSLVGSSFFNLIFILQIRSVSRRGEN